MTTPDAVNVPRRVPGRIAGLMPGVLAASPGRPGSFRHGPVRPTDPRRCGLPALAVSCVLGVAGCGGHATAPEAATPGGSPRAVPVRTTTARVQALDERLEITGTLRPRAQVNVIAEVGARLVRLYRDEGARVAANEVIAQLDATDYRLALERAEAALAVAEANHAHALAERDRAEQLLRTGGITDKEHLAAQVAVQVAAAALAQARVEVAIARQQVARTEIRAPFAGHVARRLVDEGAVLAAGTPVATLVDDSVLELRVQVPSADYGKVRLGAAATVTIDALPDWRATGEVVRITPVVDERSRSFEVVLRVGGSERLVAGLFARAAIDVRHVPDALTVPPVAIVRDGARPEVGHVFVVRNGVAERREVELGIERSDLVQVVRGLADGDLVVVDPPVALVSGAPVEIQNGHRGPQG